MLGAAKLCKTSFELGETRPAHNPSAAHRLGGGRRFLVAEIGTGERYSLTVSHLPGCLLDRASVTHATAVWIPRASQSVGHFPVFDLFFEQHRGIGIASSRGAPPMMTFGGRSRREAPGPGAPFERIVGREIGPN